MTSSTGTSARLGSFPVEHGASPRRFLRLLQPRHDAVGEVLALCAETVPTMASGDVVGAVVLEIEQRAFVLLRQLGAVAPRSRGPAP